MGKKKVEPVPEPVKEKQSPNFIQVGAIRLNGRPVMIAVRDDMSVWVSELTGLAPGETGSSKAFCLLGPDRSLKQKGAQ